MSESDPGSHGPPTARTEVRRAAPRACYDPAQINAILDEAFVCHVACAHEGQAFMVPMVYARRGGELLLHGSTGNRTLRAMQAGAEVTLSVMQVDALVLARSAFHNSVNYRSVIAYGRAREVRERADKLDAFRCIVEHAQPGRWPEVRPPNETEFRRTLVLALSLEEASAKVRSGGPIEEDEDWELGCWAGVVPLGRGFGTPVPCERLAPGVPLPEFLKKANGQPGWTSADRSR